MNHLKPPIAPSDHRAGADDAPVTLVEFGDYECPHCAAAQPAVRAVLLQLGPRVLFAFRHFPLAEAHPHAEHAAEAAEAAGSQGSFWEMHEALFEDQADLEDEDLVSRAAQLGLDVAHFEQELAEGAWVERVRRDFTSGVRSGVNGTPTFFINGVRHDGPWDAESLLAALAAAAATT